MRSIPFSSLWLPALLASCLTSGAAQTSGTAAPVVSANDLVMTRQDFGETMRDQSVSGTPLRVGGKAYATGIGTHATSMIPVRVQGDTLSGLCGIDDNSANGAAPQGSVEFRILSGSEVLWRSGEMRGGMPAREFNVKIPAGTTRLYLLAHPIGDNAYDHADWLDLKWSGKAPAPAKGKPARIDAARFGLKPGDATDQSAALAKAIAALRAAPAGSTLSIPKGTYHFTREGALEMSFHVSNHDQPNILPIGTPFNDLSGKTIAGNGALFLFDGQLIPLLAMDSRDLVVKDLAFDISRPYLTEARIAGFDGDKTILEIDPVKFPWKLAGGRLTATGPGWTQVPNNAIAFRGGSGHIVPGTADLPAGGAMEDLGDGKRLRSGINYRRMGLQPGDILNMRDWSRPFPGAVIYRTEGLVLDNVPIHQSFGMGLLAQRSADIRVTGGGSYPRPESGRIQSAGADATHFSNTRGHICVEKGKYVNMMDDAINVHSTCLSIVDIPAPDQLRLKYMHNQAVGFEVFLPGETLRFIAGPTLENLSTAKIKAVRKLSTTELLVTLEKPVPAGISRGDAVENADFQPSVDFSGNYIANNRARGSLLTTPKKVVIKDNTFDHSSGSAILLAGDAQGWYESGACEDIEITGNKFLNNLTSRFQFTEAIIAIYPEVRQLARQQRYYHRNVRITGNSFVTHRVPLLFAISTEGLTFANNNITWNDLYPADSRKPFTLRRCDKVNISGNKTSDNIAFTLDHVTREMTPDPAISFTPLAPGQKKEARERKSQP